MDALAIFNSFEAVFWMTIGIVVFQRSRVTRSREGSFNAEPVMRRVQTARGGSIAAAWFVLFGISDVIEVFTGAWWRPWPLLVLKAACVIALITCGIIYRARQSATRQVTE